jgi:predicted phage-related endonuclease
MAISEATKSKRENKVNASFVPYLMSGNEEIILSEWQRLVGDPDAKIRDTSHDWLAQLGNHMEPFILFWHERKTGQALTRRQEHYTHPDKPYVGCTIDAFRESEKWILDVKNFHSYRDLDQALALYVPQIIVQRRCVPDAIGGSILYCRGGMEPVEKVIEWPADYEERVWKRIDQFWKCVETLTPPFKMEDESAPLPPSDRKPYDFTGNNKWADLSTTWLENVDAGEKAEDAKKDLKKMVPKDASEVRGHGVIITRSTDGKLFVKKVKNAKR